MVTQNLGWAVSPSFPLPTAALLLKVVLNQAKGTDDKMQLSIGSSGRMLRLSASPASRPLHLQLQ